MGHYITSIEVDSIESRLEAFLTKFELDFSRLNDIQTPRCIQVYFKN